MAKRNSETDEDISGSLITAKRCKEDEYLWYAAKDSSEESAPESEEDEKKDVDITILEEKVKRMNTALAELKASKAYIEKLKEEIAKEKKIQPVKLKLLESLENEKTLFDERAKLVDENPQMKYDLDKLVPFEFQLRNYELIEKHFEDNADSVVKAG